MSCVGLYYVCHIMFVVLDRLMLHLVEATVSVRTFNWLSCLNAYYCL